jgi:virginiamycin B lyase
VTEYAVGVNSFPYAITAGPDGKLWFTLHYGDKIGKITTSGVVTEYSLPTNSGPTGITAGPDGNLWFAEGATTGNAIAKITTSGVVTKYALPVASSERWTLLAGRTGICGSLRVPTAPWEELPRVGR